MKRFAMFVSPIVVLSLVLCARLARAEDQPAATGSVTVTVQDKDGKAVEGATVRITAGKQAAPKTTNLADTPPAPADKSKNTPVAEGKTDKDGKVTLDKVPAGSYNLAANLKGTGNARQKITVKAGETLSVELKLAPRATPAPKQN